MKIMNATVAWSGGMRFVGRPPSGHEVLMDAPTTSGGEDAAARPMELLLLGLGGCTGMDVVSILGKMRRTVTSLEISLAAEQDEDHPRRFRKVALTYRISGKDLDEEAVRKAVSLSQDKYCSAAATLRLPVEVTCQVALAGASSGRPASE